jgi:hydroxymethylpyrimidine/phosphomethylpyrimidine kinase / thiaminase
LEAVLHDTHFLAIKTGMLYDEATIRVVTSTLQKYRKEGPLRLVCDPVFVSTSGHALLVDSALESLIDGIFPLATLVTPNKHEAERILSHERKKVAISSVADMVSVSKALLRLGPKAVLLKGGHVTTTMAEVNELLARDPAISTYKYGLMDENMKILQAQLGGEDRIAHIVVDVLQCSASESGGEVETSIFIRPRIESTSTHGTGCTLSAAIACGLAGGLTGNPYIYLPFFQVED